MNYKTEIIDFCNNLGLSEIGFCKSEVFLDLKQLLEKRKINKFQNEFEENNIELRVNPRYIMEEGKTIISIAFPYLYENEENEENEGVYFSKYTRGLDYHKVISKYLEKLCEFIVSIGGKAQCFVDSNALPERYIANKSGVGFIGKNNMLINKKYGSYVFLGEVITDLEIESDKPMECMCLQCEKCISVCPTKSINKEFSNSNMCLSFITQKKYIEDYWFPKFGGRLFGCDSCQSVCPYNVRAKYSKIDELKPLNFMSQVDMCELINMDNKTFKEKYKLTSAGWRGKNIIQRNAIINVFIRKEQSIIKPERMKSSYVIDYYNRLLQFFKL